MLPRLWPRWPEPTRHERGDRKSFVRVQKYFAKQTPIHRMAALSPLHLLLNPFHFLKSTRPFIPARALTNWRTVAGRFSLR